MRLGLALLLANVVTIVCSVLAYLLVEHDHPGFAVAFLVLAFCCVCVPSNDNRGDKHGEK